MQPIHKGLDSKSLYSGSNFRSVSVCLDSGMLATEACRQDARGVDRTSTAYCYAEDIPKGICDKHVLVDYCTTGGGVSTEYCKLFAAEEGYDVKIEKKALVRLTQTEVDTIKRASGVGLYPMYSQDNYVWLINGTSDGEWHGFTGSANKNTNAPYLVCPVHTKEAWEKYQEEKKAQEETTEPSDPAQP